MDIEGAEYEVITSLCHSHLRPSQLLVAFHHRFPGIGNERSTIAIEQLREAGYQLHDISDSNERFSFVHEDALSLVLAS